jgi:acetate kinase
MSDMKAILEAEASGDEDARLAVEVYLHRLRGLIAAMAAALEGLDVLVFTGGVGERSAAIRARAAGGLGFLGVEVDERNDEARPDAEIGSDSVRSFVIAAREDLEIARGVRSALAFEDHEHG